LCPIILATLLEQSQTYPKKLATWAPFLCVMTPTLLCMCIVVVQGYKGFVITSLLAPIKAHEYESFGSLMESRGGVIPGITQGGHRWIPSSSDSQNVTSQAVKDYTSPGITSGIHGSTGPDAGLIHKGEKGKDLEGGFSAINTNLARIDYDEHAQIPGHPPPPKQTSAREFLNDKNGIISGSRNLLRRTNISDDGMGIKFNRNIIKGQILPPPPNRNTTQVVLSHSEAATRPPGYFPETNEIIGDLCEFGYKAELTRDDAAFFVHFKKLKEAGPNIFLDPLRRSHRLLEECTNTTSNTRSHLVNYILNNLNMDYTDDPFGPELKLLKECKGTVLSTSPVLHQETLERVKRIPVTQPKLRSRAIN